MRRCLERWAIAAGMVLLVAGARLIVLGWRDPAPVEVAPTEPRQTTWPDREIRS